MLNSFYRFTFWRLFLEEMRGDERRGDERRWEEMAMAPPVVPCADFKKSTFLNHKRNLSVKNHKQRAN